MRAAMYSILIPYVFVCCALLFLAYYMALKTFLGTANEANINGSGYAAQTGRVEDFYMYSASEWDRDLCSYAYSKSNIKWKNNEPVYYDLVQDERPFHCKV